MDIYFYGATTLLAICLCLATYCRVKIILGELLLWVPFTGRRRRLWGVVGIILPLLIIWSYYRKDPQDLFRDRFNSNIGGAMVAMCVFIFSLMDGQVRREGIFSGQWLYTWDQLDYYTVEGTSEEDFYELKLHTLRKKWFRRKMRVIKWKFGKQADLEQVTAVFGEHGVYQENVTSA